RLVEKFRELPHARHAIARNDIRRRNLGITVLAGVQVEQELNQRAFQPRAPVRVKQKAAARQLGAARKIHQLETLAKFDVRLRLESERRLVAPGADKRIVLGALADGDG